MYRKSAYTKIGSTCSSKTTLPFLAFRPQFVPDLRFLHKLQLWYKGPPRLSNAEKILLLDVSRRPGING